MAADAGTIVVFRAGPSTRFPASGTLSYLANPVWAASTKYRVGDVVITTDTGTGTVYNTYECIQAHTSVAGDSTAGSASAAGTLAADKWDKYENDVQLPVSDFTIDFPTTESTSKRLIDRQETATSTNGPPTLTINLDDAADRNAGERLLGRGNARIWIGIFRGGMAPTGEKGIKYEGYAKVNATSVNFPGGADGVISKTLNFTADEDDAFLEVEYTGT